MNDSNNLRRCLGLLQSCGSILPPPFSTYIDANLDTAPKVVNHFLMLLITCNAFLVVSTLGISLMTFFTALLLICQTVLVVMVMNHSQISFAPRALAPTDFMVGLCLGLCIGGVILAFFTSVAFRRFYALCKYAEQFYSQEDHTHACGNLTNRLWWNWLWCSLVFWLDLITAFLIAAGRHELSYDEHRQYQSIGGQQPPEQYGSGESFQQQSFQQSPSAAPGFASSQSSTNSGPRIMPV
jgi:hypothetical protein